MIPLRDVDRWPMLLHSPELECAFVFFETEFRARIRQRLDEGATLDELAGEMDVAPETLRRFYREHRTAHGATWQALVHWHDGPGWEGIPVPAGLVLVDLAASMYPDDMQTGVRRFLLERLAEAYGTDREDSAWVREELADLD